MKKLPLLLVFCMTGLASITSGQTPKKSAPVKTTSTTSMTAPAEDSLRKADLVDYLFTEQSYLNAQIIDKCFTLKLSPSCWDMLTDKSNDGNQNGYRVLGSWVRYAVEYAKREKIGDFYALAVDDKKIEKENRPMIDEMIKVLQSKFSMTIEAPYPCTGKGYEFLIRYPDQIMSRIGYDGLEWSPESGEAHFTTVMSTTATDISVKASADGKHFTITGPAYVEAYDTQSKISKGLNRWNKNR